MAQLAAQLGDVFRIERGSSLDDPVDASSRKAADHRALYPRREQQAGGSPGEVPGRHQTRRKAFDSGGLEMRFGLDFGLKILRISHSLGLSH